MCPPTDLDPDGLGKDASGHSGDMRTSLRIASVVLALGLATGCSQANDAVDKAQGAANKAASAMPDVDWSKYGNDVKQKVDNLAEHADCGKLRRYLRRLDDGKKLDLTKYVQQALDNAGCGS